MTVDRNIRSATCISDAIFCLYWCIKQSHLPLYIHPSCFSSSWPVMHASDLKICPAKLLLTKSDSGSFLWMDCEAPDPRLLSRPPVQRGQAGGLLRPYVPLLLSHWPPIPLCYCQARLGWGHVPPMLSDLQPVLVLPLNLRSSKIHDMWPYFKNAFLVKSKLQWKI